MRQMAVWIPDWPMTAAEMAGDAPLGEPAVILGGRGVLATNVWARATGISTGMGKRQAQAIGPDAVFLPPDPARDTRMFEPVLRALDRHVARVCVRAPGSVIFPASGPVRAAGTEEALAERIVGEVAETAGCEARVGAANGTLATLLAAREARLVAPEEVEAYLGAHPTSTLLTWASAPDVAAELGRIVDLLSRLGVRRLGEVRALGRAALTERFGAAGLLAWNLAAGGDVMDSLGQREGGDIEVSRAFDPGLESTEQAAFTSRILREELVEALGARGASGGELAITATAESGREFTRTWAIEGASAKDLADRVRWQFSAWISSGEEGGALVRLELRVSGIVVTGARPDPLWGGRGAKEESADRSAERIRSILGEDAVRAPRRTGGRTPQESILELPLEEAPSAAAARAARAAMPWPGRIPDPAPAIVYSKEVNVRLSDARGHALVVAASGQLRCREGCESPVPATLSAEKRTVSVENFAGPWILEQRWWDRGAAQRRAYLQVGVPSGALLLYTEHGGWKAVGRYA